MEFTVIKNSESQTGYDIKDDKYIGVIPGYVCGWQYEVTNDNGDIKYLSVIWEQCDADELAERPWVFDYVGTDNLRPTGRVIFRGYAEERWDAEERDYYVVPVSDEELAKVMSYMS